MPALSALAKERREELIPDAALLEQYSDHIHERGACSSQERLQFLCEAFTQTAHRIARCDTSPTGRMVKSIFIRSFHKNLRARMDILFRQSSQIGQEQRSERKELRKEVRALTALVLA